MTQVVVLHDLGDHAGGAPWRDAFAAEGLDVAAPDLPGHGGASPPVGGNYVRADAGYLLASLLDDGHAAAESVLVGVGHSGWIATVAAVGSHVGGVVLVDGLGRPWRPVQERLARRRELTRALLADTDAMAPHLGPGPDPRLGYVQDPHGDEALAIEAAALVRVPALVIEPDLVGLDDVEAAFAGPVTMLRGTRHPSEVARQVAAWLAGGLA